MLKKSSYCRFGKLVIHTPHAGQILPIMGEKRPMATYLKRKKILSLHNVLTDHFTDILFASNSPYIKHLSFPFSRLFCDVERLANDPLEKKGLGICYDLPRFAVLDRDKPVWSMSQEQAITLYNAHHQALSFATIGGGLLLDCHSFSERDNIICKNAHKYKDIDICLGFNDDDSKPDDDTLNFIAMFFQILGYIVAFNKPFSNAISTGNCRSLMIEVNKHCYMNEDSLEPTSGFEKLHSELQILYNLLLCA